MLGYLFMLFFSFEFVPIIIVIQFAYIELKTPPEKGWKREGDFLLYIIIYIVPVSFFPFFHLLIDVVG